MKNDNTAFRGAVARAFFLLRYSFREGTFLIGGGVGVGRSILEIFGQKSRGPPTSQIGFMHDPS